MCVLAEYAFITEFVRKKRQSRKTRLPTKSIMGVFKTNSMR